MKYAMLNKSAPFLLTLILSCSAFANEISVANIPKTGATAEEFCPPGWKIEAQLAADLNGDGVQDKVLQLIGKKPGKNSNGVATDYRALIVVFARSGKFELADYATKLLLCSTCGGQLGASIDLDKGKNSFSVDQSGGGGNDSFDYKLVFKYDPTKKQFIVSKADVSSSTDRVSNTDTTTSYDYEHGIETITKTIGEKEKKTSKKFVPKIIALRAIDAEKLSNLFKG